MSLIGIIANPASGKDVRRIVCGAQVVSHQEKINIITRLIAGLDPTEGHELVVMPDASGLARKIMVAQDKLPVRLAHLPEVTGTWKDTVTAVNAMVSEGAKVIVTLGGDGTNRIVAKACGDVPLIPISTGTNNVFPMVIEGTLAGLAAGRVIALGDMWRRVCTRAPKFEIVDADGELVDIALIDIAVVRSSIRGALAVWEVDDVHSALVTGARADVIGLSAIAGAVVPQGDSAHIILGGEKRYVRAAIAPGIVPRIPIADVHPIKDGIPVPLGPAGAMLALDGERELRLEAGRSLFARLKRSGPWVVDVSKALSGAAHTNLTDTKQKKDAVNGT